MICGRVVTGCLLVGGVVMVSFVVARWLVSTISEMTAKVCLLFFDDNLELGSECGLRCNEFR